MSDTPIHDNAKRKAELNAELAKYAADNIESGEPTSTGEGTLPTGKPQPKVVAATVGAGVGSALATVVVWIIGAATSLAVPEAVELAFGVILTGALAFVGGYWKRN